MLSLRVKYIHASTDHDKGRTRRSTRQAGGACSLAASIDAGIPPLRVGAARRASVDQRVAPERSPAQGSRGISRLRLQHPSSPRSRPVVKAVVDASVLVAALVDAGHEGLWAESAVAEGNLAAPELAMVETTNILRRLEHIGELSRLEATSALRDLLRLDLALFPFAPFGERVWALRSNLSSYDAWYVALAEALGCPLLTLDGRLSRATGPSCEIVIPPR